MYNKLMKIEKETKLGNYIMKTSIANFKNEMIAIVQAAVVNPENRSDNGDICWNGVDGDTYMAMDEKFPGMENFYDVYYELFDDVCDRVVPPAI